MVRGLLSGLLLLLFAPAYAVAQDFMISPNGKHVARHVLESSPGVMPAKHRFEIIGIECLQEKRTFESCVVLAQALATMKGNRPRWTSDSTAFVTGARQIAYGLDGSQTPLAGYLWAVEPRVLDRAATDQANAARAGASQDARGAYLITNGQGAIIGQQDWETDAIALRSSAGSSLVVPMIAVHAGDVGSARRWLYPGISGESFFYWSPNLGDRGRLVAFEADGLRDVELPSTTRGPVRMVADEATNQPIALQDAFGLHPLASAGATLNWLAAEIGGIRSATGARIWSVTVSGPAQVAFVRTQPTLSPCFEDWLATPGQHMRVTPACETALDVPAYGVSHVELPGPVFLPSRLYRSGAVAGGERNLIIYLHGGPHANSLDAVMLDNLYADASFDILAVDFRGSTGLGYAHVEALRPPVGDISAEDLRQAVDWARAQPEYADGLLGVWGSSWGGLAVHAIASRNSDGIDFMVSNSGFIENPPHVAHDLCTASGWVSHVYGARKDEEGNCLAAYSGALGRKVTTHATILTLSGAYEQSGTPFKTEMEWATQARRDGACVSTVYSASGGHAGGMWPEEARTQLATLVRAMIDHVSAGRRRTCGIDTRLP